MNRDTSIYLPKDLKDRIIETAKSEGFNIGRGRKSSLADFVRRMLLEHKARDESSRLLAGSLTPTMYSLIHQLEKLDLMQQRQVAGVLEPLLTIIGEQNDSRN